MINAGDFNKRIDIVRHNVITDKDGFTTTTETVKVASAWAKVNTTRGFTLISQGTNFEQATTAFLIRKPSAEIKRKDIVRFKNLDWSIEYLNDIDEDGRFIELQCRQVNNENRIAGGQNG